MSFLNELRDAVTRVILKSPMHPIISQDTGILTLTDPQSGNYLSYPVGYEKMGDTYLVFRRRKENCWKKFEHGAPVRLKLEGKEYEGWAIQFGESEPNYASIMSESELAKKYLPDGYDHETASKSEKKIAMAGICILKVKIS